jgi:hypothetical protein
MKSTLEGRDWRAPSGPENKIIRQRWQRVIGLQRSDALQYLDRIGAGEVVDE